MDYDDAMKVPDDAKDKNFRYSWVTDEPKTQTIARLRGYEAVLTSGPSGDLFKGDPRVAVDGRIRVGDVVLMRCPATVVAEREAAARAKNRRVIKDVKEEYHAQVTNLGIQTFEEETK